MITIEAQIAAIERAQAFLERHIRSSDISPEATARAECSIAELKAAASTLRVVATMKLRDGGAIVAEGVAALSSVSGSMKRGSHAYRA